MAYISRRSFWPMKQGGATIMDAAGTADIINFQPPNFQHKSRPFFAGSTS